MGPVSSSGVALAAYGTLAPGESNHRVVADIDGRWLAGSVRGHRWNWDDGPYAGLPALVLDPDGPEVAVSVLVADRLDVFWPRLDRFEGPGYRRVTTPVTYCDPAAADGAPVTAWIYEALVDYDGLDGVGPVEG